MPSCRSCPVTGRRPDCNGRNGSKAATRSLANFLSYSGSNAIAVRSPLQEGANSHSPRGSFADEQSPSLARARTRMSSLRLLRFGLIPRAWARARVEVTTLATSEGRKNSNTREQQT